MSEVTRPGSGGMQGSRADFHNDAPLDIDLTNVIIRRTDGDDCHSLEQVIDPHTQDLLDLLYNYPRLIQRVEACYLSITIVDAQSRVIGLAIFEDFPQGLEGMYDYLHENCWEQWLPQAFDIREEFDIRPFNSLWLVYFYLDRKNFRIDVNKEIELLKMILQNVYGTNPNVEGINFLLRGDVVEEIGMPNEVKSILNRLFVSIPSKDPSALKKVRGIHPNSQIYYSPRQKCFEYVEIRIAKQEDHDDLAEIFNKQSEVLTAQFGEFFIAELIAFQNENQKALVAQVGDRAVGLMSISKDIDYKLLAEGFELDQYDNLLKPEFMEAVKDYKEGIDLEKKYKELDERRQNERKILEEKMLTSHWGQRIALQQHLKTKEPQVLADMDAFISNEENNKTLAREGVEKMIDEWLAEFKLTQPGSIFAQQGVKDPEINCWIVSERNFFLDTLTYFGLPKDYLQGNGHWHDWAYNKLQERKQMLLRKQPKAKKVVARRGKARQEEKKEEELKEPEYFDLVPLQRSFTKFMAASADVRTTLRNAILDNIKKFVFIFSDENGELMKGRHVDVTELGDYLKEAGIPFSANFWEHIPYILHCFGDLQFDKKVTKVMPQEEKAKREEMKEVKSKKMPTPAVGKDGKKLPKDAAKEKELKEAKEKEAKEKEAKEKEAKEKEAKEKEAKEKDGGSATKDGKDGKEEAKTDAKAMGSPEATTKKEVDPGIERLQQMVRPNDITEMFSSYEEIISALEKIKAFDQMMLRLGVIKEESLKDQTLKNEVKDVKEKEEEEREEELRQRQRNLPENSFRSNCIGLPEEQLLPEIPLEVHNAIAINLFCIDENYESRSIDFLEYAFNLFPDRDYIILTQPHIVNESILLQSFLQIPKKKNAVFDDVLYIFHRDALLAPLIQVRRSTIEDIQDGKFLYAHMSQAAQIESDALESIKSLTSNKIAFTVLCQDTIIGFYILTKDVNLLYYKSHFAIQDFMVLNEHPRNGFSKILYAILNPVFSKYTRYILKELMRLANKTCLYFEIHRDTALPDIFSELILTRNRKFPHLLDRKWNHERDPEYMEKFQDLKYIQDGERDPMDEKEAPFSLALITKKLLSINKINDNTRVVVVGASDTGISLIESLLSVRYVNFPHITLLAPGGMRAIHAMTEYSQLKSYSTNYTLVELRNLLLDSRITVIDARMVNIDRKNKTISLDKQAILPYDVLVLTLGLCDTTLQDNNLVSEGIGVLNEMFGLYPDKQYVRGLYSIDDPYLYDIFAPGRGKDSPIARLTRRKRPENIVLYGKSLHMYCFINGLINRGVKPERITLVIPPKSFEKPTEFTNNQEKWDYEDRLVADPPAFDDPIIEEKVHQILEKLGVTVMRNLMLSEFDLDYEKDKTNLIAPIFKKYGENGEPLEKKAAPPGEEEDEEREFEDGERRDDEQELEEGAEGEEGGEGGEDGEGEEGEKEAEEDNVVRIPTKMLVTSRTNDIDLAFFSAIHDNGLVYNGRLIVKRNFQTTDPAIFAAGRLCEFSQRYKNQAIGTPLRLDKYSGREVGQKLARSIMEHIGLLTPEANEGGEEELPSFFMPLGVGGVLPNDLFYYYVRKIEWTRPQLTIDAKKNRQDIVCDNIKDLLKGHYIKFTFDNNGIIDSVTYLGSEKIIVQSLVAFVGLSEKYLNKLDTRFNEGLIENVAEFLSENWAIALYHEWFSIFRHKIKMEIANKGNIQEIFEKVTKKARKGQFLTKQKYDKLRSKISLEVTKVIEDGTLDFIRENLNHLPMYYIPDEEFK